MSNTETDKYIQGLTDEDLQLYIDNYAKYRTDYLQSALSELKSRNINISEDKINAINEHIANKTDLADEPMFEKDSPILENNRQDHLYTDDENAPLLYSKQAIWVFSVVFMPIFGSVMMAQNIKANQKGYIQVIIFGILYTVASLAFLMQIPRNTGFTLMVNGLGAMILTTYFWNRYIGNNTLFRKRKIWRPLIIALLICMPFVLAIIFYGVEQ
ncbi:MAG: hypothetical protein KDC07_09570 [Chitinophagaceae bacterium]|nr:hypothetical protein [Chitinophagaceae bacterium]MCB9046308.1 hypothetical protein [Chitinophagales bacterium]